MKYWVKRYEKEQEAIRKATVKDIEKQLKKYYASASKKVINDFEATYNKVRNAVKDGKEVTPADLFALDAYWQMQAQLKEEMQELGDKQIELLTEKFTEQWLDIYNALHLPSEKAFSTISVAEAKAMITSAWVMDGKTFSERIWNNTERLVETLNENLIDCVVTGRGDRELRKLLQERFKVSYNRADALVITETAHIQTMAAAERYKQQGITHYEYFADTDGRTCKHNGHSKSCEELDGKIFAYSEMQAGVNCPPMHVRCRCTILPVIDSNNESEAKMKELSRQDKIDKINEYFPSVIPAEQYRLTHRWQNNLDRGYVDRYTSKMLSEEGITERKDQLEWVRQKIKDNLVLAEDYMIHHYVFCEDCGKPIPIEGRSTNAVKRCPECQVIYRKKYKAQKEKERRAKKKKNK